MNRGATEGAAGTPDGFRVLIVDPDAQNSLHLARDLGSDFPIRATERASGLEALSSFAKARFDAVITRQWLGDTDCWRWIRMARSGRFRFAATPVFVLCSEVEKDALEPSLDAHTWLVTEEDPQALRAALAMARAGVRRHSVLVVMDDPAVALGTVLALHKHYRVGATDTAEGALSLWRAQRHDLVLLDLQLSRAGGEPVLSELLRENPRQPVIVFTEPAATGVYLKLMLTGAVDYLPKPVDTRSLPEICARVLRQQACVASADRSVRQESEMAELFGRVRAAQYTLERGQTRQAARHLRAAVIEAHRPGLSDDEWARLLGEDDNRGGA